MSKNDPIVHNNLRDQFAIAALPSIIDSHGIHEQVCHADILVSDANDVARIVYVIADAMIKARGVQAGMPSRYKKKT